MKVWGRFDWRSEQEVMLTLVGPRLSMPIPTPIPSLVVPGLEGVHILVKKTSEPLSKVRATVKHRGLVVRGLFRGGFLEGPDKCRNRKTHSIQRVSM